MTTFWSWYVTILSLGTIFALTWLIFGTRKGQRQEKKRHAEIHGIAREPVNAADLKGGRRFPGLGCCTFRVEAKEPETDQYGPSEAGGERTRYADAHPRLQWSKVEQPIQQQARREPAEINKGRRGKNARCFISVHTPIFGRQSPVFNPAWIGLCACSVFPQLCRSGGPVDMLDAPASG